MPDAGDIDSRPPAVAERRFAGEASTLQGLDMAARIERMYQTNLREG